VSEAIPKRDPDVTARTLEEWLARRIPATEVGVTEMTIPKAGFSNETILGHARWGGPGAPGELDFVLRIEPTSHQLFVTPDALRQAQCMRALAGHVPVPRVWLAEADPSVLGAPFFLMTRVDGRVPSDVPSWHKRGWTASLDAAEAARLHENALAALVALHSVDTRDPAFAFLEPAGEGTALQRLVADIRRFYEWCEPVRRYGADVIDAAMTYVIDAMPADERSSIVWGDARVGNIMFGDDLAVVALLDWEGATLGPPEVDIAWWVMFDEFLCEAQGLTRLAGVPDRSGTLARYEELRGEPLRAIGYYEVLAGLQFALINSRLADLLIRVAGLPESVAGEYVTRVTDMTRRTLDRLGG
jgi:aminoglycoside phosphotransferase (APT) family kinase protein